MVKFISHLISAFLCVIVVLPVVGQEKPDTVKVEEEIVVEINGGDRRVRIIRDGDGHEAHIIPDRLLRRLDKLEIDSVWTSMDSLMVHSGRQALVITGRGAGSDFHPHVMRVRQRARRGMRRAEAPRDSRRVMRRGRRGDRIQLHHRAENREAVGELREMEMEARRLARLVYDAEGDERAQHEQALTEYLGKIFDLKLQMEMDSIEAGRKHLDEQSEVLDERKENRSEIIENRLNTLLGHRSAYDW